MSIFKGRIMKIAAIPTLGVVLGIAFSVFFAQEAISAEKAQRLCLVNSPAELIACRRGDSFTTSNPALCMENIFWILLLNIATQTTRLILNFHTFSVCTQELKRKLQHKKCVEKK